MNQFRLKWYRAFVPASKGLIGFLLLLFATYLPAQPIAHHIKFDHFGENEGLKSSNLSVLHQDPKGYLWVGGLNGLFRYDGRNFHH
ncbi:MAG: hypothetical protein KDC24_13855, partial [Saprospiraceae bacterium]|nr:hypothetical protein [Saprospiraceae bacterium]